MASPSVHVADGSTVHVGAGFSQQPHPMGLEASQTQPDPLMDDDATMSGFEGSGASSSNGSGSGGQVAPFTGFSLAKLAPAGMDPKFVNFFDQLFQGQNMMMVAQVAQNQNRMMSVISKVGVKFQKGLEDIKEHVEDLEGKVDEKVGEVKDKVHQLQLEMGSMNANLDQKISAVLQDTDFKSFDDDPLLRYTFQFITAFGYNTLKGVYIVDFVTAGGEAVMVINVQLLLCYLKLMDEKYYKQIKPRTTKAPQIALIGTLTNHPFKRLLSHNELYAMLESAPWKTLVVPPPGGKSKKESTVKRATYDGGAYKAAYVKAETDKTAQRMPALPLAYVQAAKAYVNRKYPTPEFKQGDGLNKEKDEPHKISSNKLKLSGKSLVCTESDEENAKRLTYGQPMTSAQWTPARALGHALLATDPELNWRDVQNNKCKLTEESKAVGAPFHVVYGFKRDPDNTVVEEEKEPHYLTNEQRKQRLEEAEPGATQSEDEKGGKKKKGGSKKTPPKKGSKGKKGKGKKGKKDKDADSDKDEVDEKHASDDEMEDGVDDEKGNEVHVVKEEKKEKPAAADSEAQPADGAAASPKPKKKGGKRKKKSSYSGKRKRSSKKKDEKKDDVDNDKDDLPLAKRRKKAEEETTPGGEDAQENEASGDEGDGQLIEGAMVVDD